MTELRWQQRFENYKKALTTLHRAAAACKRAPEDDLYCIALIQSFKFTWDLGWKVMKDYLNHEGVNCQPTPRCVIKTAFSSDLISDGQCWIDMLDDRNTMSHVYDIDKAHLACEKIQSKFIAELDQLAAVFSGKRV